MNEITLSREEIDSAIAKIKVYFSEEFDQDIGAFEAEFLIDFFGKEIGAHFYNRGLADAQTLFSQKSEELGYAIQELEKPVT